MADMIAEKGAGGFFSQEIAEKSRVRVAITIY
jgi:hypothetical protein